MTAALEALDCAESVAICEVLVSLVRLNQQIAEAQLELQKLARDQKPDPAFLSWAPWGSPLG